MDVRSVFRRLALAVFVFPSTVYANAPLTTLGPAPGTDGRLLHSGEQWVVHLERSAIEGAVAGQKALRFALPNGQAVDVGDWTVLSSDANVWSVAGSVRVLSGTGSAVFTFGPDAVFALLPSRDGLFEIRTQGSVTLLGKAGGITPPEGLRCATGECPAWAQKHAKNAGSGAHSDVLVPPMTKRLGASSAMSKADIDALHSAGPVTIDLLGLISSELARDALSESEARTEFQHLVAVTNRAYADSGTNIAFSVVGVEKVELSSSLSGRQSLAAITSNDASLGLDVHALRDRVAADLVALIRPYSAGAFECGLAWLNGFGLQPDLADPAFGYSLTRTSPCGPHVLAHELGHNLGSHHDLANAHDVRGVQQRGAYLFSHGHLRDAVPGFATVMAYETSSAIPVGRFSDPQAANACAGEACGVEAYSDNVKSLRLMAPRVSRFRDRENSVTVLAGDVREGDAATSAVPISVRWSAPAPANGRRFRVSTQPGSATAGSDFEALSMDVELAPGLSTWQGAWTLLGDAIDESDESLILRVEGLGADASTLKTTQVTVVDDDPKQRVSGQLIFSGAAAPADSVRMAWIVSDVAGSERPSTIASAPDFRYTLDVPKGARVVLEGVAVPAPFAGLSADVGVVAVDVQRNFTLNSLLRFSGRLVFPEGATKPATPISVEISKYDGRSSQTVISTQPPDFGFAVDARFGSSPEVLVVLPPVPYYAWQTFTVGSLRSSTDRALMLQAGAVISGRVVIEASVPAPQPLPRLSLNEKRGNTSIGSPIRVTNGEYTVAVEPNGYVQINGGGPGLEQVSETISPIRGNVRRDIRIGPAPRIVGAPSLDVMEGAFARMPVAFDRNAGAGGVFALLEQFDGSASQSADFSSQLYLFAAPGSRYGYLEFLARSDVLTEGEETARFRIREPFGVLGDGVVFTLRIKEARGTQPELRLVNAVDSFSEGNTGFRDIPVELNLSSPAGPAGATVRMGFANPVPNWNMPFALEGEDMSLPNPVVTFVSGADRAFLTLRVFGDRRPEYREQFQLMALSTEGISAVDSSASRFSSLSIVDDDDLRAARSDRFVLPVTGRASAWRLAVRNNDAMLGESGFFDAPFELATQPSKGIVRIDRGAQATDFDDDDVLVYEPVPGAGGRDVFEYSACGAYGRSPCSRATVTVDLKPLPLDLLNLRVSSSRGFRDLLRSDQPALTDARYETTGLVAPQVDAALLSFDSTHLDAWDGPEGTSTSLMTLPSAPSARDWLLFADGTTAAGGDIDLYLGMDRNGDGRASVDEVLCMSAMSNTRERCDESFTQSANTQAAWWVMLHNRGPAQSARAELFAVPLETTSRDFRMTGPTRLDSGRSWPIRFSWNLSNTAPGEARGGAARVTLGDGVDYGWSAVRLDRETGSEAASQLMQDAHRRVALAPGERFDSMVIDVPPGASRLEVLVESAQPVDAYLARWASPRSSSSVPLLRRAPPAVEAVTSSAGLVGAERLSVDRPQAGQWYLVLTNRSQTQRVRAAIMPSVLAAEGAVPAVRPGGYFNPQRSGNGLFVYPAGADWAGLWYTYLQDGTPTWYYLQGSAPASNGIWRSVIFRSAWNGSSNRLTAVGEATVTPTGPDAFTYTYTLDGETGSEAYSDFGRGCPSLGGSALNVSGHWFDPERSGTGYSVQLLPNYEFYLVFGYDGRGVPRFLVAERGIMGGVNETLNLEQLTGACPLCARSGDPVRNSIGTFQRSFANGRVANITLNGTFTASVPGTWAANDRVIPLGGLQGCGPP